jgi:predicted RNase H-like nuclease (RuvC/YqgF family)
MSNENLQQSTQDNGANEIRNMAQRTMGDFSANRWNHPNDAMATIEKLYETKNENQFLKFKLETLEKENLQLEAEIDRLETELELSEVEEDGGFLGGMVDQFKKDPTATINFAKSMLNDYLKK